MCVDTSYLRIFPVFFSSPDENFSSYTAFPFLFLEKLSGVSPPPLLCCLNTSHECEMRSPIYHLFFFEEGGSGKKENSLMLFYARMHLLLA